MLPDQDITVTTIAVLMGPPRNPPTGVRPEDLEKILHAPLSIAQTLDGGLIVTSTRDQMEVLITGNKLNVRDSSGKKPSEKSVVPKVLHDFLALIDAPIVSYGLNYDITFRWDGDMLPGAWIAARLVNTKEITERCSVDVSFASVRLHIPRGRKMWNLTIEALGGPKGEKVRADLNVHEETDTLPGQAELAQEFTSEFRRLLSFLDSLRR